MASAMAASVPKAPNVPLTQNQAQSNGRDGKCVPMAVACRGLDHDSARSDGCVSVVGGCAALRRAHFDGVEMWVRRPSPTRDPEVEIERYVSLLATDQEVDAAPAADQENAG
jgi:hypothetical protein